METENTEHPQITLLRSIKTPVQGSQEWLDKRSQGFTITASRFSAALGNNKYETPDKMLRRMTKQIPEVETNFKMQRGNVLEPRARELFEEIKGVKVHEVGCITHKEAHPNDNNAHEFIAGSPDGIFTENGKACLIEIKCPYAGLDLSLTAPREQYNDQVQGLLWCLGLDMAYYVEYTDSNIGKGHIHIVSVEKDKSWAEKCVDRLHDFRTIVMQKDHEIKKAKKDFCEQISIEIDSIEDMIIAEQMQYVGNILAEIKELAVKTEFANDDHVYNQKKSEMLEKVSHLPNSAQSLCVAHLKESLMSIRGANEMQRQKRMTRTKKKSVPWSIDLDDE